MAFVPSVGDVLIAIQLVNDVYQKTVNAPGELQAAVKDVRAMKAELESMTSKVGDENSFVQKNGEAMLATITDTFEPLKEDLRNMKRLVREFNKIPPLSPQKIVFGVFRIPDVKKIQENFNNYRAIYSRAFEHVGAVADAHTAAELKAINSKLESKNKQLAKDITALKTQQQEAAKIQKENSAKMDKVLKLVEQMKIPAAPGSPVQSTSKADIMKRLLDSGLKIEDVKKIMGPMIFASQDSQLGIPKIEVGPIGAGKNYGKTPGQLHRNKSEGPLNNPKVLEPPVKAPGRSRSVSRPRDKKTEQSLFRSSKPLAPLPKDGGSKPASPGPAGRKPKAPTTENKDLKLTSSALNISAKKVSHSTDQRKKNREKINILCVDRTHGFHSALAQTYLELLRLWTANTSPPNSATINWLFARVSARDLSIPTPLTTHPSLSPRLAHSSPNPSSKANLESDPSPMKAITALTVPTNYFRSLDHPFEKSTLASRIETQLRYPNGINKIDFELNDYILCFDPSVEKDLHRLKAVAGEKDVAVLNANPKAGPKPSRSPSPSGMAKGTIVCLSNTSWYIPRKHTSVPELDEFISNMRSALKSFASQYLDWERPLRAFENGAFRTLQLSLPYEHREAISAAVGRGINDMRKVRVSGVKEMEGIWIGLAFDGGRREWKRMVWITVPKEKVKVTEEWVKGLFAKKQ